LYKTCLPGVYEILGADAALPLIFDSPHSGRNYPDDFGHSCDIPVLEKAEDRYVDLLFEGVPSFGGVLLNALFPRTYIDVNRAADDIDPELLEAPWPGPVNPTARSSAGIGLLRRMVNPGLPLYDRELSVNEVMKRIENYYNPYHHALEHLLDEAHLEYGKVWHINCHSMPSHTNTSNLYYNRKKRLADFVIGDRDGTSCDPHFVSAVKTFLEDCSFRVDINEPYSGVELIRKYSGPNQGRNSLQLEINRSLYLNEKINEPSEDFEEFREKINAFIKFCAGYVSQNFISMAAD